MRGSNSGSKQAGGLGFGLRRDVAFWQFGAFAEEELFHLFFNYFLRARVESGFNRSSFITIFECSIHNFQASFETLS